MLVWIKVLHTAVWLFMVGCIAGIYLFARVGRFELAFAMIAIVAVEVMVLVVNGMRCPLTPIAGKYTENRRPNFDIYLPEWLARYNKEVFGTLYVIGIGYAAFLWLGRR